MNKLYYHVHENQKGYTFLNIYQDKEEFENGKKSIKNSRQYKLIQHDADCNRYGGLHFEISTLKNLKNRIKKILNNDKPMSLSEISKKLNTNRTEVLEQLEHLKNINEVTEPKPDWWQLI